MQRLEVSGAVRHIYKGKSLKKLHSYLLFWRHFESGILIFLHICFGLLNPCGTSLWLATAAAIDGIEVRASIWCQNYRVLCINGRSTVQCWCSTTYLVLETISFPLMGTWSISRPYFSRTQWMTDFVVGVWLMLERTGHSWHNNGYQLSLSFSLSWLKWMLRLTLG
jgi:hypothetical protein